MEVKIEVETDFKEEYDYEEFKRHFNRAVFTVIKESITGTCGPEFEWHVMEKLVAFGHDVAGSISFSDLGEVSISICREE